MRVSFHVRAGLCARRAMARRAGAGVGRESGDGDGRVPMQVARLLGASRATTRVSVLDLSVGCVSRGHRRGLFLTGPSFRSSGFWPGHGRSDLEDISVVLAQTSTEADLFEVPGRSVGSAGGFNICVLSSSETERGMFVELQAKEQKARSCSRSVDAGRRVP